MKYFYSKNILFTYILFSFFGINHLLASPIDGNNPAVAPLPWGSFPIKPLPKIPLKLPESQVYQRNSTTNQFEVVNNAVWNFKLSQLVGFDPVKFTLSSKSDSIVTGKEFEIEIKAQYIDVSERLIFQLEGSNEFTLKMVFPKNFVVTGGSYVDFIRGKVSKEESVVSYTIKGYFESTSTLAEFILLRSHVEATTNDYYVAKSFIRFRESKNKDAFLLEKPNDVIIENKNVRTNTEQQNPQGCFDDFAIAVSTNTNGGCGLTNGNTLNFASISCPNTATTAWYKRADNELASSVSPIGFGATFSDIYSSTKPIYFAKCSENNNGPCTKFTTEINFVFGVYIAPNNSGQPASETRYYCPSATKQQVLTASCVPGRPLWSNGSTELTITVSSATPSSYTYSCIRNNCTPSTYVTNYTFNIVEDCSGGVSCTPFTVTASSNSPSFNVSTPANLVLSANTAEANVTYTWIGPNGFSNANQNPIRSNTNTAMSGKYTVTARNASGCAGTATTFVNLNQGPCVNPPPIGIYSKVINKANCNPLQAGDTVVLTATGCDFNVVWGGSGSGQTGSTLQFTMPATSVTYTAKCVDRTCESTQASITLALNSSGAVGNPKILPCNGTITLEVGCESGVPTWRDGTVSNTLVVNAVGTYNFDCKTQTCLVRTGAIVVTQGAINPPTIVGANNISGICGGTPATLNANGCEGVVTWTTPAGYTGTTTGASIQTATAGNYSAICTTTCGVSSPSNVFTLTVYPVFTITPTNNSSSGQIPVGGTVNFSVSTTSGNSLNYRWIGPDGFQNNTTSLTFQVPNVTTAANGTYTVTGTNPAGCTATATTKVVLQASCTPYTITAFSNSPNSQITVGGILTLNASSTEPNLTYLWAGPNSYTSSSASPSITNITVAANGTYTVTATNATGCTATATAVVVLANVNCDGYRIKSVNPVNNTETVNLTRNSTNTSQFLPLTLSVEPTAGGNTTGFTYSWIGPAGVTFAAPTTATQSITKPGEYKVNITKPGGSLCSLTLKIGGGPCQIKSTNYTTCKPVTITTPNATNLAEALTVGSKFYAADYLIEVLEASGSSQGWTGKGKVEVVLIGGVKANVGVEFNNIQINDCYELVNGSVKTAYDPSWSNLVDVDGVIEDLKTLYDTILSSFQKAKDDLEYVSEPELTEKLLKFLEKIDALEMAIQGNNNLSAEEKALLLQKLNAAKNKISLYTVCSSNGPNANLRTSNSRINNNTNILDCEVAKTDAINEIKNVLNGVEEDLNKDVILFTPTWQPFSIKSLSLTFLYNQNSIVQGTVYGFKINNVEYTFSSLDGHYKNGNNDLASVLEINYQVSVLPTDKVYIYQTNDCVTKSKIYTTTYSYIPTFRQDLNFNATQVKKHIDVECVGYRFASDQSLQFDGNLRYSTTAKDIDALLEELMNNAEYEEYIHKYITITKSNPVLTQQDLDAILQSLKDIKELLTKVNNEVKPGLLDKLFNFIKQCGNPTEINQGCNGEGGIVPRCIWDNNTIPQPIAYQIALMSGFVDGAASTIGGFVDLVPFALKYANYFSCWIPIRLAIDPTCSENRTDAINAIQYFKEYFKDEPDPIGKIKNSLSEMGSTLKTGLGAIGDELWNWGKQVTCYDATFNGTSNLNCCAYKQGRLVFDVASLFIGAGELKLLAKGAKWAEVYGSMAAKASNVLKGFKLLAKSSLTMTKKRAETLALVLALQAPVAESGLLANRVIQGIEISMAKAATAAPIENIIKIEKFATNPTLTTVEKQIVKEIAGNATHQIEDGVLKVASNQVGVKASHQVQHVVKQIDGTYKDVIVIFQQNISTLVYKPVILLINGEAKSIIEENSGNPCNFCPSKPISDALCSELNRLAIKGSNPAAVTKLCSNINDLIRLENIVQRLNTLTDLRAAIFLNDVNVTSCSNSNSLCNYVSNIDLGIVNAWMSMSDAASVSNSEGTAFARDYPLLVKISDIQFDINKAAAFSYGTIGGFQQFLAAYSNTNCNTCPTPAAGSYPSKLPKLDEILNNTLEAFQTHRNRTGFITFYSREPFSNNNIWSRDGGQHMLKYLADNSFTDNAISFDQNFNGGGYNTLSYDIYLGESSPIRYIECKSYADSTAFNTTGNVQQFLGYITQNNLTNLSQLKYIFNGKKISKEQAKEKVHKMFRNQSYATTIFNAKQSLFILIEISPNNFIDTPAKLFAFATDPNLDADFKSKVLFFVDTN